MAQLQVTEIFRSIQGESTWAGLPCVFVRLMGCNLRCAWCDTAYAFEGGKTMAVEEIVAAVAKYHIKLVEITGGEPLAQPECPALAQRLLDDGYTVLVETNGSLPLNVLPADAIKILDLKCPDSGMADRNYWPNVEALNRDRDEVKFVIASRRDYEWSRDSVRKHALQERCHAVLFSSVPDRISPKSIVDWILEDELPVRFQMQLHKLIWPPETRGV